MRQWFVARFFFGSEVKAARAVDAVEEGKPRGFCPQEVRHWVHKGAKREATVPVLPGYAFIEMERFDAYRWHEVAALSGFLGFIGGGAPEPVLDGRVDAMIARTGEDWILQLEPVCRESCSFRRGDRVRVNQGLLDNLTGHVEWVRHDAVYGFVAQVSLKGLFAGEVRAELPVSHLEMAVARVDIKRTWLDLPVLRFSQAGVV